LSLSGEQQYLKIEGGVCVCERERGEREGGRERQREREREIYSNTISGSSQKTAENPITIPHPA
jgi:hypothetical protein